jgi:hypothetical protein
MPLLPVLLVFGVVAGFFFLGRKGAANPSGQGTTEGGAAPPSSVAACRAAVPVEPGLHATKDMLGGHIYSGNDPAHVAYLRSYLDAKAEAATGETKRGVLAFRALQGREGSTAAINSYDNQVVTWGTGWGGLGALPLVMDRLTASSPAVVATLAACGVRYLGGGRWAVDDGTGKVVEGKAEALQVIRATPALLNLFIHVAKNPSTRDAVTDAQLGTFLATSAKVAGSEQLATQALFNFVAHLKHWAPGYVVPPHGKTAVETAAAAVPGQPSEARDRQLAPEIVKAFYGNAGPKAYIVGSWKSQVQRYALHDMRDDGLDVTGDPVLSASSPPPSKEAMA